ncbi:MAG: alpha-amylase/4-alpha-glucanotransferase domain-containing protein [Candidatus Omnitrophota bacterium]
MRKNQGKVYFVFGVHNHQPVGNFSWVFDQAFRECYLPFISLLEEFPSIKCAIHNSGPIYDYESKESVLFLDTLKRLSAAGQIEIISGGYYEPILDLISDEDKKGQISFMNDFLKKEFDLEPKGLWLAERVWEGYLSGIINSCGLNYTFLDEVHFYSAGVKNIQGYYTTGCQNRSVSVFPINQELVYKIPFCPPEEIINILGKFKKEEDTLITLFLDGEKYGLRPGTFDKVYKQGWLREFFSSLESSPGIETITPREALKKFSSNGPVDLPSGSYEKMREWTKGKNFKSFLSKYKRLNYMHKRMLGLSKKIHKGASLEEDRDIFISLWKAQTNCPYWHGLFGGFYLPHLRQAVYRNLINAENLFDSKYNKKSLIFEKGNIDIGAGDEVILKNKYIACCFSSTGGALRELSLKQQGFNLLDTINRIKEDYHKPGKEIFIYDSYNRLGLMDHILEKNLTAEDFSLGKGVDTLSDRPYKPVIRKSRNKICLNYRFRAGDLDFKKQIEFQNACGFDVCYKFNTSKALNNHNFGIEFNLALLAKGASFNEPKNWGSIKFLEVEGCFKKVIARFEFDQAEVLTFPFWTISSSDSGLEKIYQQLVILFIIKEKKRAFKMKVSVE